VALLPALPAALFPALLPDLLPFFWFEFMRSPWVVVQVDQNELFRRVVIMPTLKAEQNRRNSGSTVGPF
jgi:hypothetical protein